MSEKGVFVMYDGPRTLIGRSSRDTALVREQGVYVLECPLLMVEMLPQNPQGHPVQGQVQLGFRKPLLLMPIPERVEVRPGLVWELDSRVGKDQQLISEYEKQVSAVKAMDGGIVPPSNADIIKLRN